MQLPIVDIAPIVAEHGSKFRWLFQNKNQFRHFQNDLTGLTVLDNKSMANITRCVLDSTDKSNLSRFFSEVKWSGAVRFPVDFRLYRRYEEFTQWERFVEKDFPDETIPKQKKARNKFRRQVEPTLLADAEFHPLHESFQTKIALATELVTYAITSDLPFDTVLFDSWYLAPELLTILAKHDKKWISILKTNRNVLTRSFLLREADGQPIPFTKSKIQIKELVPLIPASAFKAVKVDDTTYYCFTKNVRLPPLGKVRLVISFDNPDCKGSYVVLVTNHLSWSAQKIIATYLLRWPIEPSTRILSNISVWTIIACGT